MRKLKLIWDFKGPNAAKTAEHHEIHLKEYIINQALEVFNIGFKVVNEMHSITFIIVREEDMLHFRDQLKPHRGERL